VNKVGRTVEQYAYDVSVDGRRFLMLKSVTAADDASNQLHVIVNWAEDLRRRVPLPQ
jgi:hypothetical protein